jgi:hypothetical protein
LRILEYNHAAMLYGESAQLSFMVQDDTQQEVGLKSLYSSNHAGMYQYGRGHWHEISCSPECIQTVAMYYDAQGRLSVLLQALAPASAAGLEGVLNATQPRMFWMLYSLECLERYLDKTVVMLCAGISAGAPALAPAPGPKSVIGCYTALNISSS